MYVCMYVYLGEQVYVSHLKMLVDVFIDPLQTKSNTKHMDVVASPWVATVFSNVKQILPIHIKLLQDLLDRVNPETINASSAADNHPASSFSGAIDAKQESVFKVIVITWIDQSIPE